MSIPSLAGPITGGAQTGFASPTYTMVRDNAVDSNAQRWIVTALGGTQTGVRIHSVSDEFSVTIVKPKIMKVIQAFNSLLPQAFKPAFNRYWIIVRKGGLPAAGLTSVPQIVRIPIDIAAGVDSYDAPNMRAMISLTVGVFNTISAGLGDTLANGNL